MTACYAAGDKTNDVIDEADHQSSRACVLTPIQRHIKIRANADPRNDSIRIAGRRSASFSRPRKQLTRIVRNLIFCCRTRCSASRFCRGKARGANEIDIDSNAYVANE